METWELLKEKVEEDDKSMVVGKKPQELWVKSKSFSVVLTDLSKTDLTSPILRNITMTKIGKIDSFSETYLYIYVLKIFT